MTIEEIKKNAPEGATHKSKSGSFYKSSGGKWYLWDGCAWFLTSYRILFNLSVI